MARISISEVGLTLPPIAQSAEIQVNPSENVVHSLNLAEEIRLRNFLELQSRAGGYGAPTAIYLSKVLTERGATVTPAQLTAIYQKEKPINLSFAAEVERALSLPQGWLSEDHEFLFALTPAELDVHNALSALSADVKASVSSIILHLAKEAQSS